MTDFPSTSNTAPTKSILYTPQKSSAYTYAFNLNIFCQVKLNTSTQMGDYSTE